MGLWNGIRWNDRYPRRMYVDVFSGCVSRDGCRRRRNGSVEDDQAGPLGDRCNDRWIGIGFAEPCMCGTTLRVVGI